MTKNIVKVVVSYYLPKYLSHECKQFKSISHGFITHFPSPYIHLFEVKRIHIRPEGHDIFTATMKILQESGFTEITFLEWKAIEKGI